MNPFFPCKEELVFCFFGWSLGKQQVNAGAEAAILEFGVWGFGFGLGFVVWGLESRAWGLASSQ